MICSTPGCRALGIPEHGAYGVSCRHAQAMARLLRVDTLVATPAAVVATPAAVVATPAAVVATRHGQYKDDDERRRKMREYQKARRALAKIKAGV